VPATPSPETVEFGALGTTRNEQHQE